MSEAKWYTVRQNERGDGFAVVEPDGVRVMATTREPWRDEEPPVRRCDWRGRWVLGDPRAVKGFCRCCPRKGWRLPHRKPRCGLPGGHYVRTSRDVRQGR